MVGPSSLALPMNVVAIDPGGVETGIVVVQGRKLIAHKTVVGKLLDPHYPGKVIAAVELAREALPGIAIAMEDTTAPSAYIDGKLKPVNLDGLRALERVVGAVLGRFSGVLLVEPASHGQGPLSAYPEPLRPARGAGKGQDGLRHVRAAWDVAKAAPMVAKIQAAISP
jgi:hypothetical protein